MNLTVLVGNIMTRNVKKVEAHDTIDKAAKIMRDEKIGSVVVMGEKQVKGIVTATDIVYKHVAGRKGIHVRDIMSTNLVSIQPSATIEEAARTMLKNEVEKVLVFDKDTLVGIITNNDILRVEPAIVEILLERMKMGTPRIKGEASVSECESCGNFSDSLEEVDGAYICQDCRADESK